MGVRFKPLIYSIGFSLIIVISVIVIAFAATSSSGFTSPTTCSASPGKQGWNNCENAFDDGGGVASSHSSLDSFGEWYNYNFNIPSGSSIDSVLVRIDVNGSTSGNGTADLDVRVSRDFGASWGSIHTISAPLPPTEGTFLIDVTSDFLWVASDFDNSNFKVEVSCILGVDGCSLDWVPVEVNYTEPTTGGRAYLAYVSDQTVLQTGDWMHTDSQFNSHLGNPSQHAMIRDGAITGISIHCAREPSCMTEPTIEARITPGGNGPPPATSVITVTLPNGKNSAFTAIAVGLTPSTVFSAGDSISVYVQDFESTGACAQKPAWCTALVEITTDLGQFTSS